MYDPSNKPQNDTSDPSTIIISDPIAARQRLHELDLSPDLLDDIRMAWSAAEASTTPFEPIMAPGSKGWFAAIGTLREGQTIKKWLAANVRCWPVIESPSRTMALTVTSGNEATGDPKRVPKTKNVKGIVTVSAVEKNSEQLSLDLGARYRLTPMVETRKQRLVMTWFILVHLTQEHVFTEVSLPSRITQRRIDKWRERIIVPPLPRIPEPGVRRFEERFDQQADVDVLIARKG